MRFAWIAAVLLTCGCSTLQIASAGEVGCAPKAIEVTETEHAWNTSTWRATCNETVYQCSSLATAWSVDYSCKPLGEVEEVSGDPTAVTDDGEEEDDFDQEEDAAAERDEDESDAMTDDGDEDDEDDDDDEPEGKPDEGEEEDEDEDEEAASDDAEDADEEEDEDDD